MNVSDAHRIVVDKMNIFYGHSDDEKKKPTDSFQFKMNLKKKQFYFRFFTFQFMKFCESSGAILSFYNFMIFSKWICK